MKASAIGTGGHFVAGLLLGIVSGVVGLYFGLVSALAAVVLVVLVGVALGRLAALSGGLIGIGGTWLLLMLDDLMRCSPTSNDCGGGDAQVTVAWLTVSAAIALVGGAIAVLTLTRTAQRKGKEGGTSDGRRVESVELTAPGRHIRHPRA